MFRGRGPWLIAQAPLGVLRLSSQWSKGNATLAPYLCHPAATYPALCLVNPRDTRADLLTRTATPSCTCGVHSSTLLCVVLASERCSTRPTRFDRAGYPLYLSWPCSAQKRTCQSRFCTHLNFRMSHTRFRKQAVPTSKSAAPLRRLR